MMYFRWTPSRRDRRTRRTVRGLWHVRADPPGDDRTLVHLIAPVVQIEVYGDPDGSPGKPALRRILYTVLQSLARLPETPTVAGEPVVTAVVSTGGGGWSPEPTGQPRYLATVRMYMHPGIEPATP